MYIIEYKIVSMLFPFILSKGGDDLGLFVGFESVAVRC
jgi:hypothetical protein